ncbi:MAG: GntR family transcriptional regulator [Oscillospiraceae bacterium]
MEGRGEEKLAIDFGSEKPIFLQVAQLIENDILRDVVQEGERSLSTNEISAANGINPTTAEKGINLLFTEDILYKKRGVGMFVTPNAKEKILAKRKAEFKGEFLQPMLQEAANLGISRQELIKLILEEKK